MMNAKTAVFPRFTGWMLLILLTAVFLRLYALTDVPPGLTHDEADHGLTAWEIVNGARGVYFTVGYGREPLYDYATAGFMAFVGPTFLAARVTAVFFSLILIAGMAAWVRRAFDEPTALLTAAGLAAGFWPVMAGRQALRSITLPALFVLALFFWWRGVEKGKIDDLRLKVNHQSSIFNSSIFSFLLAGLFLGATFYTYIPARALWVIFPMTLLFAAWRQRPFLRQAWRGTLLMLLVSAVVALPLFAYLNANPGVEERIGELSAPLTAAAAGNFNPLLDNALSSLRLFTIEGDSTWRYNIPGRPFLQPIMGGLFYLGLLVAVARLWPGDDKASPTVLLSLAWLLAGFAPVLVTGPALSMTQAMGMQPVLYLFPALALAGIGRLEIGDWRLGNFSVIIPLLLFGGTAVITARDYFVIWANAPEVRVQYETAMVTVMDYLNEYGEGATAVSTITPGRFHSPAVAQLVLHNGRTSLRWFDAQRSLLLPAGDKSMIILPGFTPLPAVLDDYWATAVLIASLPMRPTDSDRPTDIYQVDGAALRAEWQETFHAETGPVNFGDAITFLGYNLPTVTVHPGERVQLATLWQVQRPLDGAILFTHLLDADGVPIAQADRLDVPGESWQPGDWFIQLHEFTIPAETAVGDYALSIGVYTCPGGVPCPDGQRQTTPTGRDNLLLTPVTIAR